MKKMAKWPRITLVTPSYNQGQFLEETICSVLQQDYPNIEHIIIDAGSTDESVAVIKKYAPHLSYWISEKDNGQSDALNKGFAKATGIIAGWLNADDVLKPGALGQIATYFSTHPECCFLTGDGVFVNETRMKDFHYQQAGPYTFRELLNYPRGQYLPQPSVFFTLDLLRKVGPINANLHYAMDLDLWLRMRAETTLHYIPYCLSELRQHSSAKTLQENDIAMQEIGQVIEHHARRLPPEEASQTGVHKSMPLILYILLIRTRLRRLRARNACQRALHAHSDGDYAAAWSSVARALALYPPVIASSIAGRVLLRLVMPGFLKALLFNRP